MNPSWNCDIPDGRVLVKHGEIDPRLLNAMLKQLKVRKEDF